MAPEKELKLTVTEGTSQVTILHGEAPKTFELKPLKPEITGQLCAIRRYLDHQKPVMAKAHIMLNRDNMEAMLYVDATDPYAATVHGSISLNPDLVQFGINNPQKKYKQQDLSIFLRSMRFFFPNKEEHMKLLSAILNFSAKVEQAVEQDRSGQGRGNVTASYSKKVVNEAMPFDMVIALPIFKGASPVTLKVEICFDVIEGTPIFWFESASLDETIREEIEKEFAALEAFLDEAGYLYIFE